MKKHIFLLSLFISFYCNSQTELRTLYKGSMFKIQEFIKDSDTTKCISFIYQNLKYSHITDTGVLTFIDSIDYSQFIKALKDASKRPNTSNWSYKTVLYSINTFENSPNIIISNSKDQYFRLTSKKLLSLLKELEEHYPF